MKICFVKVNYFEVITWLWADLSDLRLLWTASNFIQTEELVLVLKYLNEREQTLLFLGVSSNSGTVVKSYS